MKDIYVDPSVRGKPLKARKLVIEIELFDPESFDPVALIKTIERSFLMDGQPALKVIDTLLTGFDK